MGEVVVFVTAASEQEGRDIGRVLVEKGMAACVNIIPRICSIFEWEGKVAEEEECLLIIKSRSTLVNSLVEMVKSQHSYAVPEIIALPIVDGSSEYLDWVRKMTQRGELHLS